MIEEVPGWQLPEAAQDMLLMIGIILELNMSFSPIYE